MSKRPHDIDEDDLSDLSQKRSAHLRQLQEDFFEVANLANEDHYEEEPPEETLIESELFPVLITTHIGGPGGKDAW